MGSDDSMGEGECAVPEFVVRDADPADAGTQLLIPPNLHSVLRQAASPDRCVVAAWDRERQIAVAAALRNSDGTSADLVSIACLAEYRDSAGLGLVVRQLARQLDRRGLNLVFHPEEPPAPPVVRALVEGGLRESQATWLWYEFLSAEVQAALPGLRPQVAPPSVTLADLSPARAGHLRDLASYRPHPGDLSAQSPVVLDETGRPIALIVLRRGTPGSVLQWAWTDPERRRSGAIVFAGIRMFDLVRQNPVAEPIRFRIQAENRTVAPLLSGVLHPLIRPLHQAISWSS